VADVTVNVLTPASSQDLVTLPEAKIMAGIAPTDTSQDAQLALLITMQSATIGDLINRVLARERVIESWREMETSGPGHRIFLTHFPVNLADIETVTMADIALAPTDWVLEEESGKLSKYDGWSEPVTVTYTGGYLLPDEAPPSLKNAVGILLREARRQILYANIEGVRSISHKSARVQFLDPSRMAGSAAGAKSGGSAAENAVRTLLDRYTRLWV
jgi:hypothetical protein